MVVAAVGKDLDAWCNRCKLTLAHVVHSMKGSVPHRLECKTCRDVHAYRTGPGGKIKAKRTRRSKGPTEYELKLRRLDPESVVPYKISATYAENDLIQHPKLGLGIVVGIEGPKKMSILFPEGPKKLVYGLS
jgi:ribosomal protein L44E